WRQPEKAKAADTKDTKETKPTKDAEARRGLVRNCRDLTRAEGRQELARSFEVEFRVGGLDAEEKPVPARQRETRYVEHRVIRLRQAVQRQHAQHRGERGDENRALEGHRDE